MPSNSKEQRPIILWLDDEPDVPLIVKVLVEELEEEEELPYEFVVTSHANEAVELFIQHRERIFMFLQDSFRSAGNGSILAAWKKIRSRRSPMVGFEGICGEFCTYVVDAFAPECRIVFAGSYYSGQEIPVLSEWVARDPRAFFLGKPFELDQLFGYGDREPHSWYDKDPKWEQLLPEGLFRGELKRWEQARKQSGVSPEGRLLSSVAEELAVLCHLRPKFLDQLSPREFEKLIAAMFRNHGLFVELTAQTRDGGYDIVAASAPSLSEEPILVEVKHFAPHRPVGVGLVRALYGVKALHGASKAILATSSYVSPDAKREFTRVIPWEVDFKERSEILAWCSEYANSLVEPNATPTSSFYAVGAINAQDLIAYLRSAFEKNSIGVEYESVVRDLYERLIDAVELRADTLSISETYMTFGREGHPVRQLDVSELGYDSLTARKALNGILIDDEAVSWYVRLINETPTDAVYRIARF
jgi:hypothetical protein